MNPYYRVNLFVQMMNVSLKARLCINLLGEYFSFKPGALREGRYGETFIRELDVLCLPSDLSFA